MPAQGSGERPAHHERSHARADAPAAVQPAHVSRAVIERDVIVERGVDGARAQAIGDGDEAQLPKRVRGGKAQNRAGGEGHGEGGELARAQPVHELCGEERRRDRAAADDDGDEALRGDGRGKFDVHDGPCGAQQGIGQAE